MELGDLVKQFADCVAAQEAAIAQGDAVKGNRFAKQYISAFEKLRQFGDRGRDALVVLLNDSRPEVRVMAAAYLLRHCEERARAILQRESMGKGRVAFAASQALQRWKEGAWALDPE